MKMNIWLKIMIFCFASAIFLIGFHFLEPRHSAPEGYADENISRVCSNLDTFRTSQCLNEAFNLWFKYNHSNADVFWDGHSVASSNVNFTFIKEHGGVCWHAVKWYMIQAENLGFKGQSIDIRTENKSNSHAIALIYNKNLTQYCIIDQQDIIGCGIVGSGD